MKAQTELYQNLFLMSLIWINAAQIYFKQWTPYTMGSFDFSLKK